MKFLFVVVLLVCTNLLFSQRGNARGRPQFKKGQRGTSITAQQPSKFQTVHVRTSKTRPQPSKFQTVHVRTSKTRPQPSKFQTVHVRTSKTRPQPSKFQTVHVRTSKTRPQQVPKGVGKTALEVGKALAKPAPQGQGGIPQTGPQNATKPSAHLEPSDLTTQALIYPANQVIQEWSPKSSSSHLDGGMNYSNGKLTVPFSGVYYIYTQISFRDSGSGIYVMVNSGEVTKAILMVQKEGPMFAAGVFKLNAGDVVTLQVNSANSATVYMWKYHCYFGAYLI